MGTLKEYRAAIHRALAADDVKEACTSEGYTPEAAELFANSKSVRAVRAINTALPKK